MCFSIPARSRLARRVELLSNRSRAAVTTMVPMTVLSQSSYVLFPGFVIVNTVSPRAPSSGSAAPGKAAAPNLSRLE